MALLEAALYDADHHYYEATDAFTRHMDPRFARRNFQLTELNGRPTLIVCGRVNHFIPNPTFDPVARPGCLDDFFRGNNPEGLDMRAAFGELEPIHAAYRDRDARIEQLDEQGIEACFLFPTLAVGMEHAMRQDAEVTHTALHSFNRWLDEDWGFHYRDRIFACPMISLMDLDRAVEELEWSLERGARIVHLRAAPVPGPEKRSLGDPCFDPFWARVNEAGIVVTFHAGESGYGEYASHWGDLSELEAFRSSPFNLVTQTSRPIYDALAALVVHGVFDRFPRVRVASVENGSFWVHSLLKQLRKAGGMYPGHFKQDPIECFRKHISIAPFYEEDLRELADAIGTENVLFGSDFPHAEGLARPVDFFDELHDFNDAEKQLVGRDNMRRLLAPPGSSLS